MSETRSVLGLALLYAFRMLGLFIILPVIQVLGRDYPDASPSLLGLAMGIYGASQALLQIPFGWLSDRFGRKRIITLGLILFCAGSLLAAAADSIGLVILGRALQGAGAVSAAIMALLADLTSDDNRSKAMASIGGAIGVAFAVALIAGPLIGEFAGLDGVFLLSAALGLLGIAILWLVVPRPPEVLGSHIDVSPDLSQLSSVLRNANLLRLNLGIFCLHLVLMIVFSVVPLTLEQFGWALSAHWKFYLPLLGVSFLTMIPLVIVGEKKGFIKQVFLLAIVLMLASFALLSLSLQRFGLFTLSLFVFFFGFNLLEALLPSLVSKIAPAGRKGMALGIYATCQFSGVFVGATAAGWLIEQDHMILTAWLAAGALLVWLMASLGLQVPPNSKRIQLPLGEAGDTDQADLKARLMTLPGVREIFFDQKSMMLYLKVDKRGFDQDLAKKTIAEITV